MRVLANFISGLFHPLLMITYGVILALTFTYLRVYPTSVKLLLVGGAFLSTALIPGGFIYLMVKHGSAVDLELSDRRERVVPYLIFIASIGICTFYMYKMMLPVWFLAMLVGSGISLIFAMFINFVWKIRAHALGVGGLLGGIMGVAHIHLINPYWGFVGVLLMGGLVGMSRIYLRRHTPMQVYAGFLLGFLCTFGSSFMGYYYLFI